MRASASAAAAKGQHLADGTWSVPAAIIDSSVVMASALLLGGLDETGVAEQVDALAVEAAQVDRDPLVVRRAVDDEPPLWAMAPTAASVYGPPSAVEDHRRLEARDRRLEPFGTGDDDVVGTVGGDAVDLARVEPVCPHTVAPAALAIWTAMAPTPPLAPRISTRSSASTWPRACSDCHAVMPATGIAATWARSSPSSMGSSQASGTAILIAVQARADRRRARRRERAPGGRRRDPWPRTRDPRQVGGGSSDRALRDPHVERVDRRVGDVDELLARGRLRIGELVELKGSTDGVKSCCAHPATVGRAICGQA